MKIQISLAAILFLGLHTATAHAGESIVNPAINGHWSVVAMESRGRNDNGVSFRGMRYEFDGESWTTWPGTTTPAGIAGKPPIKFKYAIDDSYSPHRLDFVVELKKGPMPKQAIYKIEGDRLYICIGRTDRPTTFSTKDTENRCYISEHDESDPTESVGNSESIPMLTQPHE